MSKKRYMSHAVTGAVALLAGLGAGYSLHDSPSAQKELATIKTFGAENPCCICTGANAKVYHMDRHCFGLGGCSDDILEVDIEYALDIGRRPCRKCAK